MSEFIKRMMARATPIAREVSYTDQSSTIQTDTVWFRRPTSGQRVALLRGQKGQMRAGEDVATFDIDLAENRKTKHLLLLYSVCEEDGTPSFKSEEDVGKCDPLAVDAMFRVANMMLKDEGEEDDPGKP